MLISPVDKELHERFDPAEDQVEPRSGLEISDTGCGGGRWPEWW
ncbi:hypothetical protein [Candidatus Nitrotoga fabula]|nr:hypothetical protein [Candidatus Nitrotoga fabula]